MIGWMLYIAGGVFFYGWLNYWLWKEGPYLEHIAAWRRRDKIGAALCAVVWPVCMVYMLSTGELLRHGVKLKFN